MKQVFLRFLMFQDGEEAGGFECRVRRTTAPFVDEIEDRDKLAKEQALLDNHEDKVEDFMECQEDLVKTTEPVTPHTSDMGGHQPVRSITEAERVSRRLSQVHDSLTKVKRVVEVNQTYRCFFEGYEKKLRSINTDLQRIKRYAANR